VTWLLDRKIECAAMILQKEFANRLVAQPKNEDYGWLAVLAFAHAKVELLEAVPKTTFYPQPEVDSVIVSLKPWSRKPFEVKDELYFIRMVKWLFTQRNKKLGKALMPFLRNTLKLSKEDAGKRVFDLKFCDRRVRELTPVDFGELANDVCS
jgi:16S rRNA (adenine1518-N6/adenine1519-N6)-dimethyltransferase